ncbi:MAG TPA: cyclic nucleotide-binding domain-containing protein [Pyrinomonadaceae bacterium]|nr:cyclic nucleotide-binding domain-containing protein [Pyrinomonadaceae bacterium]
MPREITHHGQILEAIASVDSISELVERDDGHFKYELDLEVIVYGRNYTGKKVGPYARLLSYDSGEEVVRQGDWGGNTLYTLVAGDLDVLVTDDHGTTRKVAELQPGTTFGERSVLAGQPRNATITVPPNSKAYVIEIQRPALRLLRKLKKFGHMLDVAYRKYGLDRTLLEVEEATADAFGPELLKQLGDAARFTVYGKNHVLFQEGDPVNRLVFIKNGWVRRVRGLANPSQADMVLELGKDVGIDFLGAGNCLGLEALDAADKGTWKYTANVMARTEVLEVAVSRLRANPALRDAVLKQFSAFSQVDEREPDPPADRRLVAAAGREITTGIVDGTNLLVMDMDLCIRCGNCSLACHKVHGRSRLLRRGIHIARPVKVGSRSVQHVLAPSVCLHCQDPECLTGCPTGAIGRFEEGQIDINPQTCIGCGDCATQCPYNAITMVPRKAAAVPPPSFGAKLKSLFSLAKPKLPAPVTDTENLLAVKCNLCENTPLNPPGTRRRKQAYSCQENCPTGALVRVNPREYFAEAKNAVGLVYKDQTHAIGRNIHKRDTPARLWHIFGVLATVAITAASFWAARKYTLDGHLWGTWLTMRWITGLVGLVGIAAVMTYPARKQVYRRRAGPLRYWMLMHVYLGVIAGVVLLLHGGRDTGGLLTSLLMVSFDLVIVTGLFGVLVYVVAPRVMTSIEGDPLLIEDLRDRRDELRETLSEIDLSNPELRDILKRKIRRRFLSFRYLMRQYVKREDLTRMLAAAREEFREDAEKLQDPEARRLLMDVVEATVTLRRVDALIYLHQLLKLWLAPHVVTSSVMLALMIVHIVQVIFFTVR